MEREELSSGRGIKLVKGKVGKPKVKKMNLEETLPSPFARRVEPPTQPIKADAAKKLTKKKKVMEELPDQNRPGLQPSHTSASSAPQSDADPGLKLDMDEDGVGGEGGTGDNSASKAKASRAKKEKKEPGRHFLFEKVGVVG